VLFTLVFRRGPCCLHSCLGGVRVAHRFSFMCRVNFCLFVFVLCLVYPMLSVSLDCSFLMTPSVFSNVYLFVCFHPVSYVPNVTSVSVLFILDNSFSFL
jgi:hypothetical protein